MLLMLLATLDTSISNKTGLFTRSRTQIQYAITSGNTVRSNGRWDTLYRQTHEVFWSPGRLLPVLCLPSASYSLWSHNLEAWQQARWPKDIVFGNLISLVFCIWSFATRSFSFMCILDIATVVSIKFVLRRLRYGTGRSRFSRRGLWRYILHDREVFILVISKLLLSTGIDFRESLLRVWHLEIVSAFHASFWVFSVPWPKLIANVNSTSLLKFSWRQIIKNPILLLRNSFSMQCIGNFPPFVGIWLFPTCRNVTHSIPGRSALDPLSTWRKPLEDRAHIKLTDIQ